MGFRVSPGIDVNEVDLTTSVTATATTTGALAGVFRWGPVDELVFVDDENVLIKKLGKPTNFNAETWFVGSSYLSYGAPIQISRAANTTGSSPIIDIETIANNKTVTLRNGNTSNLYAGLTVLTSANGTVNTNATIDNIVNSTAFQLTTNSHAMLSGNDTIQLLSNTAFNAFVNTASVSNIAYCIVKNEDDFSGKDGTFDPDVSYIARYPGELGNSLRISICGNSSGYQSIVQLNSNVSSGVFSINVNSNTATLSVVGTDVYSNVTFNSNTNVNGTSEFITIANNTFANGDAVNYIVSDGNTALTGLSNNSLYYVIVANTTGFKLSSTANGTPIDITASATSESGHTLSKTISTGSNNANLNINTILNLINVTDNIAIGNTDIGFQYMKVTNVGNVSVNVSTSTATAIVNFEDKYKLSTNFSSNTSISRYWEFFNLIGKAPGQSEYLINNGNSSINSDELHIVITDDDGKFTGTAGEVLKVFKGLSRGIDAKTVDGATNYWKNVINDASEYVWAVNDISGAESATVENLQDSTLDVVSYKFQYGNDGADESNISIGVLAKAYDLFKDPENADVSLLMTGKTTSFVLPNYTIDNIAEIRKDIVVFTSPPKGTVVNNKGNEAASIVEYRQLLRSSSYAFLDSGYKYMYDRYNDIYRWIPLNGDMAGLSARTESTNDAWWSPAGFNRGKLKNVVKLAYNPGEAERNILYPNDINPVVSFKGTGPILYGDKTLLGKDSAFSRINVRRLFIVLEKSIANATRATMFEFNDDYTRSHFKNFVTPYLRNVKSKRGITDFLVVCDTTNNTGEVIDNEEFVGDIYIKPARAINYIKLNFIAVRTDATFSEVIGIF